MGMIQQIINDAVAMEAEALKAEEDAQAAYEAFVKETNASIEAKSKEQWTGTQTEWPDCMTIPTFPGKCPVEEHPGACFRTDGKMWSCWADWEEMDDDDCQSMTLNDEIVGFEGACKYELYGKAMAYETLSPRCETAARV